jgi:5-oxoprolinase (ATP-hydrolysing)
MRFPVVLEDFRIRRGSGGKGQWNAGDGTSRTIRFRENMQLSILSDHRRIAPKGTLGGEDGQLGRNLLRHADGQVEELKACDTRAVQAGDAVIIETPTGGGYGHA